jgi:hypothetical protein
MKPVQPQIPSLRLPAHEQAARRSRTALPSIPRRPDPAPLRIPNFIPAWSAMYLYNC